MKTTSLFFAGVLLAVTIAQCQPSREPTREELLKSREELLKCVNASGSALYLLARERFLAHEAKGETWILSVRRSFDPRSLKKFTDGKHVIVSLPVLDFEEWGLRLYAGHYNALTIRKADLLALGGKPAEALVIYRLVKRFDNTDDAGLNDIETRIKCAETLIRNEAVEVQLARLKELTVNHGRTVAERFEIIPAVTVTNLLEVDFTASGDSASP